MIIVDERALRECVESNAYQSPQFEIGAKLAKALGGDKSVSLISPRIIPHWSRDILFLLQSRTPVGYLLIDSCVFDGIPSPSPKDGGLADRLLVFQRVCRFALKIWNHLSLSLVVEQWIGRSDCGVVFPFPKSRHSGFRVTIRKGYDDRRLRVRHGARHLFAFTSGTDEVSASDENERAFKRAFEELSAVRLKLDVKIEAIESIPEDKGYHPLVLSDTRHTGLRYQNYERWMSRLTTEQKQFVVSGRALPQRVEGPAGTGKTLCLLLRAYHLCKTAEEFDSDCKVLFISHSEATSDAINLMLSALGEPNYLRDINTFAQAIELCTLQAWCGKLLGERDIVNAQYLDQDALQAKEMRKTLIKDVLSARLKEDANSLNYLSERCRMFFERENPEYVAELLQHEIGVMIKGRASENLESYLLLPQLRYCLPTETDNDKRFVFSLYKAYQALLNDFGAFDTDDIVLTALGRLDTPIWRRRRAAEGYDAIVIDETHLFNLNELSVFHFLLRNLQKPRIIFSIDRSQAAGERGITTRMVREVLAGADALDEETRTQLIFRNAPEIVKLAEAVTSAGATLFTTFENPLLDVSSILLATDESVVEVPIYWKCANDDEMCNCSIKRLQVLCNELKCPKSDILLVAMTEGLLPTVRSALEAGQMKYVEILRRGDLEAVQKGQRERAVILSHPDFVGGLEFKGVLIVGVDEGRVPPTEGAVKEESRHFLEFKACNRLYVTISRARLRVELFFSKQRGPSKLLKHGIDIEAISIKEPV
jgi:superfamily I DNA/RNA helicase